VRVYGDEDGLPQVTIHAIALDKRGYLWVGTQDGAARYNGRAWTVVDMPNRTLSNWVNAILVGSDGSIWFGTNGGGLARLTDAGEWSVYDTTNGLPHNRVRSLLETHGEDGASTLWVGTNGGLARLSDLRSGRWRVYDSSSEWRSRGGAALPHYAVISLLETRGHHGRGAGSAAACGRTLWVGTNGGGLAQLVIRTQARWRVYDTNSGLPHNRVLSLLETRGAVADGGASTLWVGTSGGLAQLTDAGEWRVYDTTSGLPNNSVWSLLETRGDGCRRRLEYAMGRNVRRRAGAAGGSGYGAVAGVRHDLRLAE
jgi:ligand-binding sensor domain-containing protein